MGEHPSYDYKVGARYGKPVILKIHAGQMYKADIPFYQYANGVWLTDFVAQGYIEVEQ
jgi:putative RNA 2'-phosphotransferase